MDIVLNQTSSEPLYTQIYNQISLQIINGSLLPGQKLPGIRQIASELHISVIPVKMAWEELDKNGFIKTFAGSGTFVNNLPPSVIQEKKNQKAEILAQKACQEAKNSGVSLDRLLELIRKFY
jgi:GntR family transcriptional regulator